ncbi:MAG: helix-turn-helix domain-containing protein [candidate division WOR-3 bacterium]
MKFYLTDEEKKKIKNLGFLKVSQVAYFLDVNRQTVINWIKKGYLKANYLKFYKRKTYLIKAEELIRFIQEIPNEFYETR